MTKAKPKGKFPLVTCCLSTAAYTSIHAMYGTGRKYTVWLYAGKNK